MLTALAALHCVIRAMVDESSIASAVSTSGAVTAAMSKSFDDDESLSVTPRTHPTTPSFDMSTTAKICAPAAKSAACDALDAVFTRSAAAPRED